MVLEVAGVGDPLDRGLHPDPAEHPAIRSPTVRSCSEPAPSGSTKRRVSGLPFFFRTGALAALRPGSGPRPLRHRSALASEVSAARSAAERGPRSPPPGRRLLVPGVGGGQRGRRRVPLRGGLGLACLAADIGRAAACRRIPAVPPLARLDHLGGAEGLGRTLPVPLGLGVRRGRRCPRRPSPPARRPRPCRRRRSAAAGRPAGPRSPPRRRRTAAPRPPPGGRPPRGRCSGRGRPRRAAAARPSRPRRRPVARRADAEAARSGGAEASSCLAGSGLTSGSAPVPGFQPASARRALAAPVSRPPSASLWSS